MMMIMFTVIGYLLAMIFATQLLDQRRFWSAGLLAAMSVAIAFTILSAGAPAW